MGHEKRKNQLLLLLPRDKAFSTNTFYKICFCMKHLSFHSNDLIFFDCLFSYQLQPKEYHRPISNLPKYDVWRKNIDMGQRNQIRGQREREKNKLLPEVRMILKINCKLGSGYNTLSLLSISHSQRIKPAEAAVTNYCITWRIDLCTYSHQYKI